MGIFYVSRTAIVILLVLPGIPLTFHIVGLVLIFGWHVQFTQAVKPNYLTGVGTSWNQHWVELLNHTSFYYLFMGLFLFTTFLASPQLQYSLGWLYVAALVLIIGANLANMVS